MEKPSLKSLMEAVPISKSYAALILQDADKAPQTPPLNLAALIFRETGWKHHIIAEMSDEALAEIADKHPWTPPAKARAA